MKQKEESCFKAKLQTEVQRLIHEIRSERGDIIITAEGDIVDKWLDQGLRDVAAGRIEHKTRTVSDIFRALKRIELGSYGTCLRCEKEIDPKRLNVLPWAKHCIRCQEAIDQKEQRDHEEAA